MKRTTFILIVLLISYNSIAQITFHKTYGGTGSESFWDIKQAVDNGYIVLGKTNSFGAGDRDFYLTKIDSIGNMEWSKTYGGGGRGYAKHHTNT